MTENQDSPSTILDPNTLVEGEPSLNELFNKDPITLTEIDLSRIVAHYRKAREVWAAEEASSRTKNKRSNHRALKEFDLKDAPKLDELDLKLPEL